MSNAQDTIRDCVEQLCKLSDQCLDYRVVNQLKLWKGKQVSALEILEILDLCACESLCNSFVITTLNVLFDIICKEEGLNKQEVMTSAPWRKSK